MLNKKLLAVAVAAAMTQGIAHANPNQLAVDLDGANGDYPDSTTVLYADELTWDSPVAVVENRDGQPSFLTANIGFTIAEGTNKYIRIDLGEGATFVTAPELVWDTVLDEQARDSAKPVEDQNSDIQGYTDTPNPQSSIAEGGEGQDYVVFEVNAFEDLPTNREDIPRWLSFYVQAEAYSLPTDSCTTARYRLFEDAVDAQNEDDTQTLKDSDVTAGERVVAMCFEEAVVEDFTIPNNAYASVDSEYTVFIHAGSEFADHDETNYYDEQQNGNDANNNGGFDGVGNWGGSAVSATTASLGEIDTNLLAAMNNPYTDLDGGTFGHEDVVGNDPVITFGGDFSFGTWTMREIPTDANGVDTVANSGDACSVGTDISPTASSATTLVFDQLSQTDLEDNDYVLCVDVEGMTSDVDDNLLVGEENPWENGNRIGQSAYTATLSWDEVLVSTIADEDSNWNEELGAKPNSIDDTMGEIIYDSITVDVPFMSTFTDYRQRFHLTNNGPTPATYMFEFTPEVRDGVVLATPTDGTTSGVIPAGSSIVVQASEIMGSFEGRTSGVLHIGGEDEDIGVSAVVVNPGKGTIDVQDLNANSIKARKSNFLPEANNVN